MNTEANEFRPLIDRPPYRWKTLYDDSGQMKKISKRLCNTDFYYFLVWEELDMPEVTGDKCENRWCITVSVVSPEQASQKETDAALDCCGTDEYGPFEEARMAEILYDYGVYAQIVSVGGNNLKKLRKEARDSLKMQLMLFGFAMDKPVNAIGTTGWDAIKGDIMAGLRRTNPDSEQEKKNGVVRVLQAASNTTRYKATGKTYGTGETPCCCGWCRSLHPEKELFEILYEECCVFICRDCADSQKITLAGSAATEEVKP